VTPSRTYKYAEAATSCRASIQHHIVDRGFQSSSMICSSCFFSADGAAVTLPSSS